MEATSPACRDHVLDGSHRFGLGVGTISEDGDGGCDLVAGVVRDGQLSADEDPSVPNPAVLLRPAACDLIEAHDEWQVSGRRYLPEGSVAQLTPPAPTAITATTETEVTEDTVQCTA